MAAENRGSSSSSSYNHQVFLSFRGDDTRWTFTDHLHAALSRADIPPFRDKEGLKQGEALEELFNRIEESRVSIPVFSENYANSRWCLEELTKIMECKTTRDQVVLPIFYKVTPSQVRNQTGSFGKAFLDLQGKHRSETVGKWKVALTEAANLSGWDSEDSEYKYETNLICSVVKKVSSVLDTAIFEVAKHPVGIDSQVQEVLELLDEESDDVKFVGIHGMGGAGKTAIAMAVWNKIFFRFQSWSFLQNVREKDLADLQNILVTGISKEKDMCNRIVAGGITAIQRTCQNKKVLIILDDVDARDQLSALAGEHKWFGGGSRIIITTRDKQILSLKSKIYMPKLLDANQSLELFSYHAFERDQPPQDFKELSEKVVPIAGGLPLAIKEFGSILHNKRPTEWESKLERLKHIPDDQVHKTLKRSFKGLNLNDRETFLDIACFFIGMDKKTVIHILEGSFPSSGIDSLVDKSLVNVDDDNQLVMHDQLRYMGRELIRQEDPKRPERRSRVWSHEEALKVLEKCKGTSDVEGLLLNFGYEPKNGYLTTEKFKAVPFLRLLQVDHAKLRGYSEHFPRRLKWLSWKGIILKLPTISHLEELVVLDMSHSMIKEDWNGWRQIQEKIKMLKVLDLSSCINLTRTPDLSSLANLERLILDNCTGLIECHETIGNLKKLVFLSLKCCKSLTKLPDSIYKLSSVKSLILTGCKMLCKLPETMGNMESLTEFIIDDTAIEKLPNTIVSLLQLERLSARNCEALSELPHSMRNLSSLRYFNLTGTGILDFPESFGEISSLEELEMAHCRKFKGFPLNFVYLGRLSTLVASHCNLGTIPDKFGRLVSLKFLDLSHNKFDSLPGSFRNLSQLQTLELQCCTQLRSLPQLPSSLIKLNTKDCMSLERLPDMSNLTILRELCPEGCENLAKIDDGIRESQLKKLAVIKCTKLPSLPKLPSSLIELEATACDSLERLPDLSNLKNLQALRLRHCMELSEIQGIGGLSLLQKLELENCGMLEHLPELPPSLTALDVIGCISMKRLPNPLNLKKLQALNICSCMKLPDVQGISGLSVLQKLGIENCRMLQYLPELPRSLIRLDVRDCSSIERLPDLSNLKKLKELHVEECEKLAEIPSLESLESLIDLQVCECHTYINTLLKNVDKSEPPNAFDMEQIRSEYQIYYDTSGMGLRFVYELTEAPTSSSPGEENVSLEAEIKRNDGKIIKCVHDLKVEGTMMANTILDQFYSCYFEGLAWFGFPLKNGDIIKVTPTSNQRITIKKFYLLMEYEARKWILLPRHAKRPRPHQCIWSEAQPSTQNEGMWRGAFSDEEVAAAVESFCTYEAMEDDQQ